MRNRFMAAAFVIMTPGLAVAQAPLQVEKITFSPSRAVIEIDPDDLKGQPTKLV